MIWSCNAVKTCLELRLLCVSLMIIAHLRTFVSQSDSSIQRPRSIKLINALNSHSIFIHKERQDIEKHIICIVLGDKPKFILITSAIMHKQHHSSKTQCPAAQINTACWCLISQESSFINNASASVARITQNESPDPEGIGNTAWTLLKCIEKLDLQSLSMLQAPCFYSKSTTQRLKRQTECCGVRTDILFRDLSV